MSKKHEQIKDLVCNIVQGICTWVEIGDLVYTTVEAMSDFDWCHKL